MTQHSLASTLAAAVLAGGLAASPLVDAAAAEPQASIGQLGEDGYLLLPQGGSVGRLAPQEVELIRGKSVKLASGETIGTLDTVVVRSGHPRARIAVDSGLELGFATLFLPTDELRVAGDGLVAQGYDLAAVRGLGAPADGN